MTSAAIWSTFISPSVRSLKAREVRSPIQQESSWSGWKNQKWDVHFLLPGQFFFLSDCSLIRIHTHIREGGKGKGEREEKRHRF